MLLSLVNTHNYINLSKSGSVNVNPQTELSDTPWEKDLQELKDKITIINEMFDERIDDFFEKKIKKKYLGDMKKISAFEKEFKKKIDINLREFGFELDELLLNEVKLFYQEYQSKITFRLIEIYCTHNKDITNKEDQDQELIPEEENTFRLYYHILVEKVKEKIMQKIGLYFDSQEDSPLDNKNMVDYKKNLESKIKEIDFESIRDNMNDNCTLQYEFENLKKELIILNQDGNKEEEYAEIFSEYASELSDNFDYKNSQNKKAYLLDPRLDIRRYFENRCYSKNGIKANEIYNHLKISDKSEPDFNDFYFRYFKETNINPLYDNFFNKMISQFPSLLENQKK